MNNFKGNFLNILIFLHPQIPDFLIVVSQTNHTSMESLCIQLSDNALISISQKWTLVTGFVVQGQKCWVSTHRAAVLADSVCEAAVALRSDLDVVGALQEQSLLQVACALVHVGDAVLAVVGDVLRSLVGHQTHEGQLDVNILWIRALAAILELHRRHSRTWLDAVFPEH